MKEDENPFVVSGRIKPEYFCDREQESARMMKLLCNGNNVVIRSERRMGKTGLIQYCFDQRQIADNYYTFFVDILHTTCLQELVYDLGRAVYEQTVPYGKKLTQRLVQALKSVNGRFGFDAATGLPSFNIALGDIDHPEFTLEEIFHYLQQADRPCIVAIDEFQQIAKYPEKNVEALLRGHIQKIDNCRFVFAGSERHLLGMMFDSAGRPFYKSADNISLDAIARDKYVAFMKEKFHERGKAIPTAIASEIYAMFEGHTYYVQRLLNEIFSNTAVGDACDEETVQYSLRSIIDGNDSFYREILSRTTLRQKSLLYAIAADGWASQITSAAFIKHHRLSTASSVQAAIKKLQEQDLVVEADRKYRVGDRFFGLWIKQYMI